MRRDFKGGFHPVFTVTVFVPEYRGCPCPLNSCPKNVRIGPATGKAPAGGGPVDVPSALAPPGGAFRAKVRACALDAVADTHGSGKVCSYKESLTTLINMQKKRRLKP